jgi:hypothetical protein
MKKYLRSNFLFGAISFVYFIIFVRLSISLDWFRPQAEGDDALFVFIVFTIFVMVESIVSLYLMSSSVVLGLVMKIKIISAVFLVIDGILKGALAFVCGLFSILILIVGYYLAGVSAAIYTVLLFCCALRNSRIRKKLNEV